MNTIPPRSSGFVTSELIVAISLGFAIGLIVMYGVWTANRSMKNHNISPVASAPSNSDTNTNSSAATPTPAAAQDTPSPKNSETPDTTPRKLSLSTPSQYSLATTPTLNISGIAPINSTIIIYTEAGEQVTDTNSKGEFSAELKLIPGSNAITIVSFDTQGQSQRIDRTIVLNRES